MEWMGTLCGTQIPPMEGRFTDKTSTSSTAFQSPSYRPESEVCVCVCVCVCVISLVSQTHTHTECIFKILVVHEIPNSRMFCPRVPNDKICQETSNDFFFLLFLMVCSEKISMALSKLIKFCFHLCFGNN